MSWDPFDRDRLPGQNRRVFTDLPQKGVIRSLQNPAGKVTVVVPSFDGGRHLFGPCPVAPYIPPIFPSTTPVLGPTVGMSCMVSFLNGEESQPVVTAWWTE